MIPTFRLTASIAVAALALPAPVAAPRDTPVTRPLTIRLRARSGR